MSTNYYARIIPTKERKDHLINRIENNDFDEILRTTEELYGGFRVDYDGNPIGGVVHLGKRSGGWKFLWNPNIYIIHNGYLEDINNDDGSKTSQWIELPSSTFYLYPLTKDGIYNFISRPDIVIYDEYDKLQDKEEFFEEAINWTTWNGQEAWDSKTYTEYEKSKDPNWKIYKCSGEYIDMLVEKGFTFISEDKSDFYSDGLRFATNTDFC